MYIMNRGCLQLPVENPHHKNMEVVPSPELETWPADHDKLLISHYLVKFNKENLYVFYCSYCFLCGKFGHCNYVSAISQKV